MSQTNLSFKPGQPYDLAHLQALSSPVLLAGTHAATGNTTTSVTFVDAPANTGGPLYFNKALSGTSILLKYHAQISCTGATATAEMAIAIGNAPAGTFDQVIAFLPLTTVGQVYHISGITTVSVADGTYELKPRWRVAAGAGTLSLASGSNFSLWAQEVQP